MPRSLRPFGPLRAVRPCDGAQQHLGVVGCTLRGPTCSTRPSWPPSARRSRAGPCSLCRARKGWSASSRVRIEPRSGSYVAVGVDPKPYRESRGADSNRLPLLQLRVIHQALQGFAQPCKSRISKRLSLLRFAPCCTVLRSRWYQSGIKRLPLMHSRSLCQTSAPSILSASSACEGPPHPWIATMFYPEGVNGRKRKGRGHSKPRPVSVLYPTGG